MVETSEWQILNIEYRIAVSLYLHGTELDPSEVSKVLGQNPDRSWHRGERQRDSGGRVYLRKKGLWVMDAILQADASNVSDYMDELISRISFGSDALRKLNGLEESYIDIFMAKDSDEGGGGTCEFELNPHQVVKLSQIGVPVRLTVAVVNSASSPNERANP